MSKILCFQLELAGFSSKAIYRCDTEKAEFANFIEASDVGDVYTVTLVEMDEQEYLDMEEFKGF